MESALASDLSLIAECGDGCAAKVPVGQQLMELPRDQWTRIGIPLKCFQAGGANMGALAVPLGIEAGAGTVLSVHEVGYGTVTDKVLGCPAQ